MCLAAPINSKGVVAGMRNKFSENYRRKTDPLQLALLAFLFLLSITQVHAEQNLDFSSKTSSEVLNCELRCQMDAKVSRQGGVSIEKVLGLDALGSAYRKFTRYCKVFLNQKREEIAKKCLAQSGPESIEDEFAYCTGIIVTIPFSDPKLCSIDKFGSNPPSPGDKLLPSLGAGAGAGAAASGEAETEPEGQSKTPSYSVAGAGR